MMSRARWSLVAASTTVVAMAWFAAGALGESAPPDIGSRIMVGPSVEPVSDELGGGGGVRVGRGGDGMTTGPAAEPLTATPPAAAPAPAPPPADDDGPGDDDDDDDDGDDGPGDDDGDRDGPDDGDDDASDG